MHWQTPGDRQDQECFLSSTGGIPEDSGARREFFAPSTGEFRTRAKLLSHSFPQVLACGKQDIYASPRACGIQRDPQANTYALCTAPLPAKPASRILSKWRDARARFAAIAGQTHLSTTAIGKYLPAYLPTYTPTYPCLSTSLHACVSCMQCRNVYTHTKVRTYMQTDRRTASRKESGFRAWRAWTRCWRPCDEPSRLLVMEQAHTWNLAGTSTCSTCSEFIPWCPFLLEWSSDSRQSSFRITVVQTKFEKGSSGSSGSRERLEWAVSLPGGGKGHEGHSLEG